MTLTSRRLQMFERRRKAFTLLEVLVVVAILVTLASVATVGVFRYLEDSKKSKAQLDIKTLETAVKSYQTKNDNVPPNNLSEVLRFIDNADASKLNDPWGKPYQYSVQQVNDTEVVVIQTTAPDGDVISNIKVKAR